MTELRLIVFDVDGTLVDSQAHIVAAMHAAFAATGLELPAREDVLGIVGLSLPQAIGRLAPEHDPAGIDALVARYKEAYVALRSTAGTAKNAPLYPHVREVLDHLSAMPETLLAIATGKSRRGLDVVLETHGLTGRFLSEQVADNHPSKPHPSMLLAAMAETGTAPGQAIMIGDTSFDMEMGRAAGMRAIGVGWGYHPAAALTRAGAHCIVDDMRALPGAIETLFKGA